MSEKYYSRLAVNLVLIKKDPTSGRKEILLQLRQNTGYMDNMYDFACSGHVDKGETFTQALVREAREEIGITVKEKDLKFLATTHHSDGDHVLLYFSPITYEGTPTVCEPEECGGLLWADMNNLPENIIPYVANVLECIKIGIQYDDGQFSRLNAKKTKEIDNY